MESCTQLPVWENLPEWLWLPLVVKFIFPQNKKCCDSFFIFKSWRCLCWSSLWATTIQIIQTVLVKIIVKIWLKNHRLLVSGIKTGKPKSSYFLTVSIDCIETFVFSLVFLEMTLKPGNIRKKTLQTSRFYILGSKKYFLLWIILKVWSIFNPEPLRYTKN